MADLLAKEWLEADGRGGFASGTAAGIRTRRYHALLLVATTPPTGRMVLVNGFEAWITTPSGTFALSSQIYTPDVTHPDGASRITGFTADPWPTWTFRVDDTTLIEHEVFVPRGVAAAVLRWRLAQPVAGVTLFVRPLLSGRDYHALHHANPAFRFDAERMNERIIWQPYGGLPRIIALTDAAYTHQPEWYRNFQYDQERSRGLDFIEDLAAPGAFQWDLSSGDAHFILTADGHSGEALRDDEGAVACAKRLRATERQRRVSLARLDRAADAYLVQRHGGQSIVAGYPWFTDWGRDTFIALRGLCLATERLDDARDILLQWAGAVSEGMLPNRFPDSGAAPEYNSVDASLWFVVAVYEFLEAMKAAQRAVTPRDRVALSAAVQAILTGYANGTRYGIRCDDDGLLRAGETGVQLTWMDAKIGDWVVTPRIGKPVEVQALWLNALKIGSGFDEGWVRLFQKGRATFRARFWNDNARCLYDVIDVEHRAGTVDAGVRPNQILAVGGLPFSLLESAAARAMVDTIESKLLTPLGLRSLAPDDAAYVAHYRGGVRDRDGAYHQGTVWPWLMGPFVEAWLRVRRGTAAAKREARARFLAPLLAHLDDAGLGHLPEVADGDVPHRPGGCFFQAWSVGEALRLDRVVLRER
jgi:predicted glycogen debranching enzyme